LREFYLFCFLKKYVGMGVYTWRLLDEAQNETQNWICNLTFILFISWFSVDLFQTFKFLYVFLLFLTRQLKLHMNHWESLSFMLRDYLMNGFGLTMKQTTKNSGAVKIIRITQKMHFMNTLYISLSTVVCVFSLWMYCQEQKRILTLYSSLFTLHFGYVKWSDSWNKRCCKSETTWNKTRILL
jgi:hypothetical protein